MMTRTRIHGIAVGLLLAMLAIPAWAAGAPVPAPKPAPQNSEMQKIEIWMAGDELLDCGGIRREIAAMEDVIVRNDEVQQTAQNTGTGISIAKAIGGFLIGSIPGAIGVMAAGHVAGEAAETQAEDAEAREDLAQQRRSMMIGMYNAKECKGPIHSNRALRSAAIDAREATPAYGNPEDVRRFDPAAIEPAAGGRGYKVDAHKVGYND